MTDCHHLLKETFLHYIAFGKKSRRSTDDFAPFWHFSLFGDSFEPENENPLVKWVEKIFSKF